VGYTNSTVHGIEVPDSAEPNNVPEDIGKVVSALEGGSIIRRLTSAQIAALTVAQKPAGLVVYNTTTNRPQVSNGSTFSDLVTIPAGGGYVPWSCSIQQGGGGGGDPAVVAWTGAARYHMVGKRTHAYVSVTLTSDGVAGGQVTLTLPTAAYSGNTGLGSFVIPATGAVGAAVIDTTTTVRLFAPGAWYTTQLVSGQQLIVSISYEAA